MAGIQAADCHEKGKEKNTSSKGQSQRVLDFLLAEEIHSHASLWAFGAKRITLKQEKVLEFRWEVTCGVREGGPSCASTLAPQH